LSTLLSQIRVPELGDYRVTVLAQHGILTLEDLRATPEETLASFPRFGVDAAVRILKSANQPGPFARRVMVDRAPAPAPEPVEAVAAPPADAPARRKPGRPRKVVAPEAPPAAVDAAAAPESASEAASADADAKASRRSSRLMRTAAAAEKAAAKAAAREAAAAKAKSESRAKNRILPGQKGATDSDGAAAILKRGPGRPPRARVDDADAAAALTPTLGDAEGDASGPAVSAEAAVAGPAPTEPLPAERRTSGRKPTGTGIPMPPVPSAAPEAASAPPAAASPAAPARPARTPRRARAVAAVAAVEAAPAPTPVEETAAAERDFVARTALDEAIVALRQVRAHLKAASQAGPVRKARKAVKKLRATLVVLRSAISKTGVDDKGLRRLQAVLLPVREQAADALSGPVSVSGARAMRSVARTAREVLED